MPGTQRGKRNPSARGDFTGNKKEALQKEHEEAVSSRREELGLITAGKETVKQEGVIDMMGETPTLDLSGGAENALEQSLEGKGPQGDGPLADATLHGQPVDTGAREPMVIPPADEVPPEGTRIGGGTATIDVFELEPEKAKAAAQPGEVLDRDRLNEPTMIHILYDLEDVTIGYGNNFTFREGYRYRVPRWVAMHLEEKALCNVLSLSVA